MNKSFKYIGGLVVFLIIELFLISQLPYQKILVSFLDVGQGDSIFIRTPDDYTVLIDGGPSASVLDELGEVVPIYNRTIDLIVLSHPHADHVNGLVEVVKRFEVKKVLIIGTPYHNAFYKEFLRVINQNEISLNIAQSNSDIKLGNYVFIDVVWPTNSMVGKHFENVNNASLSVRVLFDDYSVLLTGDAEIEQEREIVDSGFDIWADILKAGHHGSRTASSDEFLDKVEPETVVIQTEKENDFNHPHKETLQKFRERNIEVKRNDVEGRIDFILSR
ncbi:ComEC/Rec2 family competence protein [Patescibacteria group bacterium]